MDLEERKLRDKKAKNSKLCKCGRSPVYFRRYEGRHYCKLCFCSSIEKKVKKTIGKYSLVASEDHIVVGLSGGKDSSVVLYLMRKIFRPRKNVRISALTIDEGIAGYREVGIRAAEKLCSQLEVDHHIVSFKKELGSTLDKKAKESHCTFCGVGRRYALNKASRELKATKLCVGHNLDDEAQSVLMNFFRGDLLRAKRMSTLTQDSEEFVPRIKPLRFIPEKEIALYAILKKLPFDSNECPYVGGLRPDVRNQLNEMERKYPGTKFAILDSFDKISPLIKKVAKHKGSLVSCNKCGEPTSQETCKTCELWR